MVSFKTRFFFLFIISTIVPFSMICAQPICSDSFFIKKYFKENWSLLRITNSPAVFSKSGNLFVRTNTDFSGGHSSAGIQITTLDEQGKVLNTRRRSETEAIAGHYFFKQNSDSSFFSDGLIPENSLLQEVDFFSTLIKRDADGNLIWKKRYTAPYFTEIDFSPDGDLFLLSNTKSKGFHISKLTSEGAVLWSFKFTYENVLPFAEVNALNIKVWGNSVYVCGNSVLQHFPSQLFIMKVDAETGRFQNAKSIILPDDIRWTDIMESSIVNQRLAVWAGASTKDSSDVLFHIRLDSTLKTLNAYRFNGNKKLQWLSSFSLNITPQGLNAAKNLPDDTHPYLEQNTDQALLMKIDNEMNITLQRKMTIPKIYSVFLVNKEKDEDYLVSFHLSALPFYFSVAKIPTSINEASSCFGKDTIVFSPALRIGLEEGNWKISQSAPVNVKSENVIINDVLDNVLEETLCKQYENCNSLTIVGEANICDTGQGYYFQAKTGSQCFRKVEWQLSSSIDGEIEYLEENMIRVHFFDSGSSGYLKALLPSCDIGDSILVRVKAKTDRVRIKGDSILCLNPIQIVASDGFLSYRWNNGSDKNMISVSAPGKYWVTAEDSCGSFFSDTIFISQPELNFSLGHDQLICLHDSAVIAATRGFIDYKWKAGTINLDGSSDKIVVFPVETTTYIVSATKFPGCSVKDSIKITVNHCLQKVMFPNSFSPNNDGLNDIFKPVVEGNPSHYLLRVYNRYGQIIFKSNNPLKGWDGYFRGVPQSIGMYVFTCEFGFPRQALRKVKGELVLIR